ncbi:hypothetical protein [Embleya sp. NBC_00896]|uniref:hypothetical protein n=1 Tax=Embleya sp. NBC_00896 TaxID=2975961 RepID=UPI002F90A538|nr:hypothetical protein OG928_36780 [Embleya sp. NBC_00896]
MTRFTFATLAGVISPPLLFALPPGAHLPADIVLSPTIAAVAEGETPGCNTLSNGKLCLAIDGGTATVRYTKSRGDRVLIRLRLDGGGTRDPGALTVVDAGVSTTHVAAFPCGTSVVGRLDIEGDRHFRIGPHKTCT